MYKKICGNKFIELSNMYFKKDKTIFYQNGNIIDMIPLTIDKFLNISKFMEVDYISKLIKIGHPYIKIILVIKDEKYEIEENDINEISSLISHFIFFNKYKKYRYNDYINIYKYLNSKKFNVCFMRVKNPLTMTDDFFIESKQASIYNLDKKYDKITITSYTYYNFDKEFVTKKANLLLLNKENKILYDECMGTLIADMGLNYEEEYSKSEGNICNISIYFSEREKYLYESDIQHKVNISDNEINLLLDIKNNNIRYFLD